GAEVGSGTVIPIVFDRKTGARYRIDPYIAADRIGLAGIDRNIHLGSLGRAARDGLECVTAAVSVARLARETRRPAPLGTEGVFEAGSSHQIRQYTYIVKVRRAAAGAGADDAPHAHADCARRGRVDCRLGHVT